MKLKPLDALTGIRFFAAAYIVVYHLFNIDGRTQDAMVHGLPWPVTNFIDRGCVAVNFFFVLSGFILAYNYGSVAGGMNGTRRNFWIARAARILPLYYVALLLTGPLFVQDVFNFVGNKLLALGLIAASYFFNMTLVGAWYPEFDQINAQMWTLSAEAFFYLCFPFVLVWLGRGSGRRLAVLAGLLYLLAILPMLLFCAWIPCGDQMFAKTTTSHQYFISLWLFQLPLLRLPEFIIGMIAGLAFLRRSNDGAGQQKSGGWWMHPGVALGAFVLAVAFTSGVPWPIQRASFYTPLCVWVVWTLASRPSALVARALSLRPMVLLGEASYGVYLVHLIFVVYIVRLQVKWELGFSLPMIALVFAASLIVSTLVAVALFYMVEEPARRWLRKKYQRGGAPVHPASTTLG